jgi:hypothetical protein
MGECEVIFYQPLGDEPWNLEGNDLSKN